MQHEFASSTIWETPDRHVWTTIAVKTSVTEYEDDVMKYEINMFAVSTKQYEINMFEVLLWTTFPKIQKKTKSVQ